MPAIEDNPDPGPPAAAAVAVAATVATAAAAVISSTISISKMCKLKLITSKQLNEIFFTVGLGW